MEFSEVLRNRHSTRHFQKRPISREIVEELLEEASWAPSGGNLQPWKVVALFGTAVTHFLDHFEKATNELVLLAGMAGLERTNERENIYTSSSEAIDIVEEMGREIQISHVPPPCILIIYRDKLGPIRLFKSILFGMHLVIHRIKAKKTLIEKIRYLALIALHFFDLTRMDENVQLMSIGNFTFALALAAHNRGIDSCIHSSLIIPEHEVRQYLNLESKCEPLAVISLGYSSTSRVTQNKRVIINRTRRKPLLKWHEK